mmetsp:Transcript_27986/g.64289  ORF Transcript_27986/g.64289 Transcript_27986/m.64289 type:complete len:296 (-) Transcript_27986:454-1341(-)
MKLPQPAGARWEPPVTPSGPKRSASGGLVRRSRASSFAPFGESAAGDACVTAAASLPSAVAGGESRIALHGGSEGALGALSRAVCDGGGAAGRVASSQPLAISAARLERCVGSSASVRRRNSTNCSLMGVRPSSATALQAAGANGAAWGGARKHLQKAAKRSSASLLATSKGTLPCVSANASMPNDQAELCSTTVAETTHGPSEPAASLTTCASVRRLASPRAAARPSPPASASASSSGAANTPVLSAARTACSAVPRSAARPRQPATESLTHPAASTSTLHGRRCVCARPRAWM